MSDIDKALETIRELEQQQIADARQTAAGNAEPEPQRTLEEQLAQRLRATQSRWHYINPKEPS